MSNRNAVRKALPARLLAAAGISAVVGSRVRPFEILSEKDTFPAVMFRKSGEQTTPGLAGDDGLPMVEFAVTSWAETASAAIGLAELVRERLVPLDPDDDPYPMTWAFAGGTVRVETVVIRNEFDVVNGEVGGEDRYVYGVEQHYRILLNL